MAREPVLLGEKVRIEKAKVVLKGGVVAGQS